MMRLRDALLLASTKLRTRKVRTIVTATLASLLFVAIVFAVTVVAGALQSYQRFSANGLSDRYIASVTLFGQTLSEEELSSRDAIAEAKQRHKALVDRKTADARRLGVPYNPADEPDVVVLDGTGGNRQFLNRDNQAALEVIQNTYKKQPTQSEVIASYAAPYRPIHQFEARSFGDTGNLHVMEGGKEDLRSEDERGDDGVGYSQPGIETLVYLPRSVTDPFLLPGADTSVAVRPGDAIPVIVPLSHAEQAIGLKPLPKNATNAQRLERLERIKKDAPRHPIEACYRNSASQGMIGQYHFQVADMKRNKDREGYQPPAVQFALPSETSCGAVTVAADSRTAAEKAYDEKLQEFNQLYDAAAKPLEKKLTFRIVGIAPDYPDFANINTLQSIVFFFGGSSLQGQWVVPDEMVDKKLQATLLPAKEDDSMPMFAPIGSLVEFGSADDIKRFNEEVGCNGMDCSTKPYVQYFGSSSVLIDELTEKVAGVMRWVVLVVAGIAAILMAGMAGRVITDSRRETAVFRAIGARRSDIRMIYTSYILMFSLIVSLFALALGLLAAYILDLYQHENLTTVARLMFIETTETGQYTLVGYWPAALLAIVGAILATGLIAITLPLMSNLRRDPLNDMRSE